MTLQVLIMAGGTGGHVFPALAVADVLTKRGADIIWMGTAKGIEAKLVVEAGYPLHYVQVQGLRGNGTVGWILAPFKLLKAVFESLKIIYQIKPDVVLGLGGFASGPGGVAAWLLTKPLVIHEQNAIPGLTNRLLAYLAKRVLSGFQNSFDEKVKAQWVGNPVRDSIATLPKPTELVAKKSTIHLLILGGSLGARTLNMVVPRALALLNKQQLPQVIHQCGQQHTSSCQYVYDDVKITAQVRPFISDMAAAYQWADLVICRAGALTIAELTAVGVGSILVPYPHAVDDHQAHNASALVQSGGAVIINECELTAELLAQQLQRLISDRKQLLIMAITARSQAKTEAAHLISDICQEVANG